MVAAGDDVHPTVKEKISGGGQDAVAHCRVFSVTDDHIHLLLLLEGGQLPAKEVAAGLAHHIADHHHSHEGSPFPLLSSSFLMSSSVNWYFFSQKWQQSSAP